MVDSGGLENRCPCKRTVGSNPTSSAIIVYDGWSSAISRSNRFIVTIILFITFAAVKPVSALTEIGLAGVTGWTDNYFMGDPQGWGFAVMQSLSQKVSVRAAYYHLDHGFLYIGTLQFGLPPPNPDTTRYLIHSHALADIFEISLMHSLVEDRKLRLEAVVGVGLAKFELYLGNLSASSGFGSDNSTSFFTFAGNVKVKQLIWSPLALQLGFQYRPMSQLVFTTDSFDPFSEVKLSSVQAVFLVKLFD